MAEENSSICRLADNNGTTTGKWWTDEETYTLIALVNELKIVKNLDGKRQRNLYIFKTLHQELEERGISRTVQQIRSRWKFLKKMHRDVSRGKIVTGTAGVARKKFFKELDEILNDRPLWINDSERVVKLEISAGLSDASDIDIDDSQLDINQEVRDTSSTQDISQNELDNLAGPSTANISNRISNFPKNLKYAKNKQSRAAANLAKAIERQSDILEAEHSWLEKYFEEQREWEENFQKRQMDQMQSMLSSFTNAAFSLLQSQSTAYPNSPSAVHVDMGSFSTHPSASSCSPSIVPLGRSASTFTSSQTRLLIKGGRIVNDDSMFDGDVYIEDGVIKQVGTNLIIPGGTRTLEAKGKLVIPGGIDADVHLQLPFMGVQSCDDFYHGTKAALAGGTTMIVDCVLERSNSMLDSYDKWRGWADEKACCDYGLAVAITSWSDRIHEEMELLSREKGVNAFAASMAYKGTLMMNDEQLINLFRACKQLGAIAEVHAENGDIIFENEQRLLSMGITGPEGCLYSRPEEVEAEATNRAIVLANQCNCPVYIQRISSKSAADVLAAKRKEGCVAFGETLAACVGTDGSHYFNKCWRHAAGHVTTPPLRADPSTPGYLLDMLGSDNVQVLASNNLTFSGNQKALGGADFTQIPHGLNGLEDRMAILWEKGVMTGKLDPCHFVAVTSTNAAKIFNIYPRKGRIQVGSDADVVVWDPTVQRVISAKTHQQAVDFNIFEGMECHGVPLYVISQGRLVLEEGQLHVSQGSGRYVPMPAFSPFVYARIQERDQCILQKVSRDAYEGPIAEGVHNGMDGPRRLVLESPISPQNTGQFHARPPTRSGGRNLQDSTFSLSGAQIDDEKSPRSGIRVHNPPGGRSTGLW